MSASISRYHVERRMQPLPYITITSVSLLMSASPADSLLSQSQINLNRPANPERQPEDHEYQRRKLGGAFNPALTAFDPNSSNYTHADPGLALGSGTTGGLVTADASPQDYGAPQDWIQCPPSYEGHRASYDCSAYIMCCGGEMSGEYLSCMGLKFDNEKGVCDWGEDVVCDGDVGEGDDGGNGEQNAMGGEAGGVTYSGDMETATAFQPMSWSSQGEDDSGKPDVAEAWNGGSDWGGSWVEGVWVPAGEEVSEPSQKPALPDSETSWVDQAWDPSQVTSYPPPSLTAVDEFLAFDPKNNNVTKVPREFKSEEGWSVTSRKKMTVIGYYASWRWYDNQELAKPANMKFQKVDRVNFAFFQANTDGDIWGTDPWADPITLFGPTDWMVAIQPELNYAPQFNDDNGFDDSAGEDYKYVGAKYVDLGEGVYCHRSSPKGKRDCKGHMASQGLIGRAHSQGAQVYVSIGGWTLSDAFPTIAGSATARRNFAKNCVGLVREYGFDGIDIDWEFPGYEPHQGTSSDKQNFVLLLNDVRAALDAYQRVVYPNGDKAIGITAALPCVAPIIDGQDVAQISSIVTEMNLMSHSFHGTWNDQVGVNAPLFDQDPSKFESSQYSVDGCVQKWIKEGANPDKINIGLPFYGRSFGGSTKLYSSHSGSDDIHWYEDKGKPQYHAILEKLPEMISLRDDKTKTQFAYFDDDKGGLVSFDDNQAICDKIEYAVNKNLHGYSIWDLSGDLTEDFATPLLDVVNIKLFQGNGFNCSLLRAETRDEHGKVMSETDAEPNPWYANWEIGECVNDGKQSTWEKEENLFRFKTECCSYKFEYRFDECLGPATYAPTSYSPSLSPLQTLTPTDNPTHVYGAAQVITDLEPRLDAFGNSITPTASITRLTEDTSEVEVTSQGGPDPGAPMTWCFDGCKGDNEQCVGNQNNPQAIDDETCAACLDGQTFWPCDVDGLCFCWDPATPRIPPAPASGKAQLSDERPCDYFTEDMFNHLGPNASFPYTYEGLCDAIDHYNEGHAEKIFMMGTEEEKKHEFAAFLGHTLHESDEWKAAREYLICGDNKLVGDETWCKPCTTDEFDWETMKCTGVGLAGGGLTYNGYCDYTIQPPIACPCNDTLVGDADGYIPASSMFFGRGAIQLSWNYNFRAASEALASDASSFCDDPDLVATNPEYAWGAGIFFWMENLKEETTCHIEAMKNQDFGGTLNNINGGLECPAYHGGWHGEAVKMRLNRYCRATAALGLDSIMSFAGCKGLNASYAECLGDDTCPDCVPFSDGVEPLEFSEEDTVIGPTADASASSPTTTTNETATTATDTNTNETSTTATDTASNTASTTALESASNIASTTASDAANNTASTTASGAANNTASTTASDTASNTASTTTSESVTNTASTTASDAANNTASTTASESATNTASTTASDAANNTASTTASDAANTAASTTASDAANNTTSTTASATSTNAALTSAPDTTTNPASTKASDAATNSASTTASDTAIDTASTTASAAATNAETTTNTATMDAKIESGCPDGLNPVDGLQGCCLPEIAYLGDGACDPDAPYNTPECNFDKGDCCQETCDLDSNYGCSNNDASQGYGPFGFFCLNPDLEEYIDPDQCTVSDRTRLGDGRCDPDYNTVECKFDGGDCCEQSCDPTYAYFECGDPAFPYDCKDEAFASDPATIYPEQSSTATSTETSISQAIVTTTTSATSTISSSTSSSALEDPSLKVTVAASQLATIVKNDPDTPHGSDETLQIKGISFGPNAQDVIIRFVIPASESTPTSATMRIYALSNSASGGIFHVAPESGSWSDETVTWNNAPDYTTRLGNLGKVEKDNWYEVDVTSAIKDLDRKRGPVTIRIRSRNQGTVDYSSRKGGHPPELVISYPLESEVVDESIVTDSTPSSEAIVEAANQEYDVASNDPIVTESTPNSEAMGEVSLPPDQEFMTSSIVNVASNEAYITVDEYSDSGNGLYFYPVWGGSRGAVCSTGEPPSWATGPYLKKTKKLCCDSYFMLQKNECMSS